MKRLTTLLLLVMAMVLTVSANNQSNDNIRRGDSCMVDYDLRHALEYYLKALPDDSSAALRMRIANAYYRQSNYAKSLDIVNRLPADSLDHDTMHHLFDCCKALGLNQRTIGWGEALIKRWPMDGEAVAKLAKEYLLSGLKDKAEIVCNRFWLKDETCMAVNDIMADVYMAQRQWVLAKDSYLLLLQQGDSTYKNMLNLGVSYERLEHPAEARKALDVAIAMSDSSVAAPLYHQGVVLGALGDYKASMDCFHRALQLLRPDSAVMFSCYRGLAEGEYAGQDYRRALDDFVQAEGYDPNSISTPYYIGICSEALGKKQEAKAAYQRFLQRAADVESPNKELRKMMADAKKRIGR